MLSLQRGEEKSLYSSKVKMKVSMMPRKCIGSCSKDVQCTGLIKSRRWIKSRKEIIDAACCGAFKRKSAEEANHLIEDLAKSNYRAPSETSGSISRLRGSGVIELNKMSAIEAKLDALINKVSM